MNFHINDITLYMACPLWYHFKKTITPTDPNVRRIISRAVKTTLLWFFGRQHELAMGNVDLRDLAYVWETYVTEHLSGLIEAERLTKLYAKKYSRYLLTKRSTKTVQRISDEELEILKETAWGWNVVYNIYDRYNVSNRMKLPKLRITEVAVPYKVGIGDDSITGDIDLVFLMDNEKGNKRYYISKIWTKKKPPLEFQVATDITLTMMAYAHRLSVKMKETRIRFFDVVHDTFIDTTRDGLDFKMALNNIIPRVITEIKNNKPYPRWGFWCALMCDFQDYCIKHKQKLLLPEKSN